MHKLSSASLAAAFCFSCLVSPGAEPPHDWKTMEVEAKWSLSKSSFERMILELADEQTLFGYSCRVRWSGVPRKYVDYYYESPRGALSDDLHSLRHRTRYTSDPRAANRSLSALINATWEKDWERIQYKSTPRRIGAVWFRREVGDCRIWDSDNSGVCPDLPTSDANQIITDPMITHEALTLLSQEHPGVDRQDLRPILCVTDFRYRVILVEEGSDVFEVSLDHLLTENLLTESVRKDYEAELEIIADEPDDDDLADLFRLSKIFQDRYELTPSTTSKGGNEVPEVE